MDVSDISKPTDNMWPAPIPFSSKLVMHIACIQWLVHKVDSPAFADIVFIKLPKNVMANVWSVILNIVGVCHMAFLLLPKTLILRVQLCQIHLQTWYWTIFITYYNMKFVGDTYMCLKNPHCLKQQNLYFLFFIWMINFIRQMSELFAWDLINPHRSFHFLCGFLFLIVQRSESNAFSVHQL